MIITELYKGQGLGNQLWCYVTTRVIALDKKYNFGIMSPENFKGENFMNLDFGKPVVGGSSKDGGPPESLPTGIKYYYNEKKAIHPINGSEIRLFDKDLVNVKDETKIDGLMQDEQYIIHRKKEIKEWLKVKDEYECYDFSSDDICIINFRGTGYVQDKDFFLPKTYWQNAIKNMLKINPNFKFVVITEDVKNAKKFFPDFPVYHFSIAKDYVVIKNAHYLILSNSSFAWFPAWLSEKLKYCIAPKYWARHNISDGYWSMGYNITTGWMYQGRLGNLSDYTTCLEELNDYIKNHKEMFLNESPFKPTLVKSIKNTINIFNTFKKETSVEKALISIIKLNSLKIFITLKRKIWLILNNFKKSESTKDFRKLARKILDMQERFFRHIRWNWKSFQAKKNWKEPLEIVEYRKKIKIYDCFTFFDELDLLEIRLNILNDYVDYFVIIEANKTFSGTKRELVFEKNKKRYKKWKDKIIYQIVDDVPNSEEELSKRLKEDKKLTTLEKETIKNVLESDTVGKDEKGKAIPTWLREFYIKESIKKSLINLKDTDFCFISDLDEIWNPKLLIDYSQNDVFKLRQTGYMYFLNNRSNQEDWYGWLGTICTRYKNIKNTCLNHLRTHRKMKDKYIFLQNGGWHFAFQGGFEGAKKKLEQYNHFWYDPQKNLIDLEKKVINNKDVRGQTIKLWRDEGGLPKYLLENKEKYKKLFK